MKTQAPSNGNEVYTLIKHSGETIFKELAFWEGGFRYRQVAEILKKKYGSRLTDLIPTLGGWLYLGGDSFVARGTQKQPEKTYSAKQAIGPDHLPQISTRFPIKFQAAADKAISCLLGRLSRARHVRKTNSRWTIAACSLAHSGRNAPPSIYFVTGNETKIDDKLSCTLNRSL